MVKNYLVINMEINSYNIRTILLNYYRFTRGYPCVGEVYTDSMEIADVLIDTKKFMIEIEIKVDKYDLRIKESKKKKHKKLDKDRIVNKFFICVPTNLVEEAKQWIIKTNPKYGLIEIHTYNGNINLDSINFVKNAKVLQKRYYPQLKDKMLKRLSSALTNEYIGKIK